MFSANPRLGSLIAALPKTETHLHLEGALPYGKLRKLDPARYPENPDFHAEEFRFRSFEHFDEVLLGHALPWFVSAERYHEAAVEVFARHQRQNVRYVEISFHLPVGGFIGVPPREILAAIRSAIPEGLDVRVFAGMLRSDYVGLMQTVIDDLENWDELDGVDLHGNEAAPTEAWISPVWARLRDAGKITKSHAGEFDGAHRVREAIEQLGVRRIQHGVRASEDDLVMQLAKDHDVVMDICPISNLRLGVVPSLREHPLKRFLNEGICCTVSTDDPLVLNNTVIDEYAALHDTAEFSAGELLTLIRNGWRVALLDEATKAARFAEMELLIKSCSVPI